MHAPAQARARRSELAAPVLALLAMLVVLAVLPARASPGCSHNHTCTLKSIDSVEGHRYEVDGKEISMSWTIAALTLRCGGADVLSSGALSCCSLPALTGKHHLTLVACPPPARDLSSALAALNLTVRPHAQQLVLNLHELPREPPLRSDHFRGLENVTRLTLGGLAAARAHLAPHALDSLHNLRSLKTQDVVLSDDVLDTLPCKLQYLRALNADVSRLPSVAGLHTLLVESAGALNASHVERELRRLMLRSAATTLPLLDTGNVSELEVANWTESRPGAVSRCACLTVLRLTAPAVRSLPPRWLVNCSRLETLDIMYALRLTELPPEPLLNSTALTFVAFRHCALLALPDGFLGHAPNLTTLALDGNRLHALPSSAFPARLQTLNLSSNDLEERAVRNLTSLESLSSLDLSGNPRVGDVCNASGVGVLWTWRLWRLQTLLLNATSVSRLCAAWLQELPALRMLDLSRARLHELPYEVLVSSILVNTTIVVEGEPVVLRVTRGELAEGRARGAGKGAVMLRAALACDCRTYRARLLPPHWTRGLRCAGGGALSERVPDDMTCSAADDCARFEDLPTACACDWRPEDTRASRLVRVHCEHASMRRLPRLHLAPHTPHPATRYRLLLANNSISHLDLHELDYDIEGLDLRNNNLSSVSTETAKRLELVEGALLLAGNPLVCDCHAAALLSTLHARAPSLTDLAAATCSDGTALESASPVPCAPPAPAADERSARLTTALAASLAVVLALALAAVLSLASRERRLFVRAVLLRWGCVWRAAESPEEAARPYDAFVTFSHADEAAALELVRQLEPAYRLCVHYRDWTPGRLIAEQAAESVERSRCTVALVSRHFLAGTWAQVVGGWCEAHSPRLVLVLLEERSALPLDATLRRYLRTSACVRWTDPWLWHKMRVALPPPRLTVPPPPATATVLLSLVPLVRKPKNDKVVMIQKSNNDK